MSESTGFLSLYEIRTGRGGESYCRAYAWAESEDEAVAMFRAAHPREEVRGVDKLFDQTAEKFLTPITDYGFPSEWESET